VASTVCPAESYDELAATNRSIRCDFMQLQLAALSAERLAEAGVTSYILILAASSAKQFRNIYQAKLKSFAPRPFLNFPLVLASLNHQS
jgi:hypothetical protein